MMQSVTQQRLSFGNQPIVLVGDPRRCVGVVAIHNPGDRPIKLRRIQLRTSNSKLRNSCDGDALEIRLLALVCACETKHIEVSVSLPASTPPGCYEASLDCAQGASCPVSIHVLERRLLRLSPPTLSYAAQAGSSFKVLVTACNLGNVPTVIPTRAALALHDRERGWHNHFHAAARTHGEQGSAPFLDAFVRRMAEAEPPVGRTRVIEGAGSLAPDESRLLEIDVALPEKLRAPHKYTGVASLGDGALSLNLYVDHKSDPVSSQSSE